jgi:hypothetical protein
VVTGFLNWWDSVELWLSGLPFVAQTAVVMPVVLLLAFAVALLFDVVLGNGIRLGQRLRRGGGSNGSGEHDRRGGDA